ncbi:tether containing UBX domain for GLUT4 isoform X2 [Conger conger]|uniref:tether containing UBX domain for GLUT4 isoform X2 n=1 Tax=Conger conger TaxID=82655 RepID=UPI002A5A8562|nr:tether containing UBX domain for GLUT4 isoform X2 [Conger conger]
MAASSTAVTVLAPNGRRQIVKISPSTPLLQVLEDVCKKQGFSPDDYDLKFQRTVLDLSLQWRFASLPNNAKLEMVPGTRQRAGETRVRIALQLEDGSRVQDSFSNAQTLWELISRFPQTRVQELQQSETTPVCLYMRDEVAGEESLRQTTLRSLGLTAGTAIIRFVLKSTRSPGDGVSTETVAQATEKLPEPARPLSECRPTPEPLPQAPPPQSPARQPRPLREEPEAPPPQSPARKPRPLREEPDAPPPQSPARQPRPLREEPEAPPPQSPARKPRPLREEPEGDPEPQQVVRAKARPLHRPEEEEDRPGPSGLRPPHAAPPPTQAPPPGFVPFSGGGQRLGGDLGPRPGGKGEAPQTYSSSPAGPPQAKKHKPSDDAKQPNGATLAGQSDGQGEELLEPVDREALLYHMDAAARRHDNREDPPDEFFEVTVDDIRKRFAQLKSERRLLEEAPLMTKALRESRMKEKVERYPKVVVRVQFPDRHVLQGFFRPLETVGALRQFVKSHLENPHQSFYLFIAPPKSTLDDPTATLFQANLFPAALIYFGSDVQTDSWLQRQLLDSSVSALQADEAIAGCMPRSPTPSSASLLPEESFPPPVDPREPANPQGAEPANPQGAEPPAPQTVRTDPSQVPKWLKLPGKK